MVVNYVSSYASKKFMDAESALKESEDKLRNLLLDKEYSDHISIVTGCESLDYREKILKAEAAVSAFRESFAAASAELMRLLRE